MLDHPDVTALYDRYLSLAADGGTPRARDAAEQLGVSEAELVEAKGTAGLSRALRPHEERGFAPLLEQMPEMGEVMVLTRNQSCVHERHGTFGNVRIGEKMGLVLNKSVDLRIFINHWASGFAVEEDVKSGKRLSLQFFDPQGTAIHKIYATAKTDRPAFEALIEAWVDRNPQKLVPLPPEPPKADRPDSEIDVPALRRDWQAMTDTHQFFGMLRRHKTGRLQALRLAGDDLSHRVAADAAARMLDMAAADAVPIMVFVANKGCIQIHSGPVSTIKTMGPWLNVLDPEFNLHLRTDHIAESRIVRKPTKDGIVTSLELFDSEGGVICTFFGERHEGEGELAGWRDVLARLEREVAA
ncbi:hemin-degrading factor [Algicella marina]|uniref:Hemin-degrading factor n=1 Tax=Algicella marina TaxID=2683284 RepID=A0A6P1T5K5_9RHOB|nr:ChuX/HutX family heme-like substrate-binding protein [Algicella marina]QHQ37035.1 hemin-degrading factor [Algicella marina]